MAACRKVQLGEVSRARQCLTGAALAPGNADTLRELQSKRPREVLRPLPQRVREFHPESPLELDRDKFLQSLKTAPRGSSPGPGGFSYEHLKIMMDEEDTLELLYEAATSLAQAKVPSSIASALMSARLTALVKKDGGVRGVATGCSLRRLVARALAKQFSSHFEEECAPFQYALSTRAGTDCVGHLLRAATDASPTATVLSVDGIGAFDHVLRSAMMSRLEAMVEAKTLLPFVLLSYGQPSTYSWHDDSGERWTVTQAEGGEQGDPLMPLLFSIGIQGALEKVSKSLKAGEHLCAFLDDIFLVCEPDRVRFLYDQLAEALSTVAGIRLHQGKTRVWNTIGQCPEDIADLGPEVWSIDGIKVLGPPLGNTKFVSSIMEERVREEQRLWEAIPFVPDLQCAWQILLQSASPRANHSLRTMPPSASEKYAREHDEGIWSTVKALLVEVPGSEQELADAAQVASLPMRMGGLGLRSAQRCAHAAYWASWADALPMIQQRTPAVANTVIEGLQQETDAIGCIGELRESAARLDREGFWWRPAWRALSDGQRPPESSGEPGEWPHGWQYWASSVSDSHFREVSLLSSQTAARRAHLRSHSGWNAGAALAYAPTAREYTVPPPLIPCVALGTVATPTSCDRGGV